MNAFKKIVTGSALAICMTGTAYASPINVGGVMWDPNAVGDFSAVSANITQSINPVTGELSGFGVITGIDGSGTFCPSCELTLTYNNYLPTGSFLAPNPGLSDQNISYTGGIIDIYVEPAGTAPALNPAGLNTANTTDGALWLSLAGHPIDGATLTGTAFSNGSLFGILEGAGLWDVTGGLAAGNFNTNTMLDGADVSFSTSFTQFPLGANDPLLAYGTGNFNASSIPEPGSVALLGLGLALVTLRRRRQV
jgi:hypothetical protein